MSTGGHVRWLAAVWTAMICITLAATGEAALGFGRKSEPFTPSGQGEPYISDSKGSMKAFLQPPERNQDKDWMYLRFTDYSGPRIRVAVMKVTNKTATADTASDTGAVVVTDKAAEVNVSNIEGFLTSAVFNTNRFEVVDRKDIEKTLQEQDLGASGRAKKGTVAKTGQIQGAEYLIYAEVNEYTPVKSRTGGSGGKAAGPLGIIGLSKSVSEVAMSFRVVDTATSVTVLNTTQRATAGSWDVNLAGINGGGGSGGVDSQHASPIGYAVQACINKAVYNLVMKLKGKPWSGSVIRVAGQQVYVDAGSASGLKPGVELVALSQGAEVRGLNGESLGQETAVVGTLRLMNVQEKYSVAEIVEGCKGLKPGDRVELRNTPTIVVTSRP
jgi:curli biogenesis system outer membrane secretion channel CsgG